MNTFQKRVLALGVASVFGLVCQGQVGTADEPLPARGPNAGPSLTISGTVFNPSGAPASGVVLMLVPPSVGRNAQVTTDAEGKYTLAWQQRVARGGAAAPTYSLIARDLEHNFAVAHTVDGTTSSLDLHLQPALTISANIQTPDGKPIPNATGILSIYSGNSGMTMNRPPANAINAANQGRIQFTTLPQGFRYSATFRAAGYGLSGVQTIQETDTHTTRFDLPTVVLKPANLDLAGQVLGANGSPAAGARVIVSGVGQPNTNVLSDSTGHFALKVSGGPVTVSANLQGANGNARVVGGDTKVVIHLGANNNGASGVTMVNGANGATIVVGQPTPVNGHTITGTVFTPSGAPAPGVDLSVTPGGGGPAQESKSDTSGKFTLSWRPIQFGGNGPTVNYSLMGRDLEHNFAGTVGIDEGTKNIDLHLKGGLTLSGVVQDNNGGPVTAAAIRLIMMTPPMSTMFNQQPATVDKDGAFSFVGLPQGQTYNLNVTSPGFGQASVQVGPDRTQTASLQLPAIKLLAADQKLEGKVVGPDDKPVAGANVNVSGPGQPAAHVISDANGHFALKVCEGLVRLSANLQPGRNGGAATPGAVQFLTGNMQVQSGDVNVTLKLTARQVGQPAIAGQPARAGVQAQPRRVPLREPIWSLGGLLDWPGEHSGTVITVLVVQLTAIIGTTAGILWTTRRRRP